MGVLEGLGLRGLGFSWDVGMRVEGLRIGSFCKLGIPYFGALILRILLFRVLY